MEALSDGVFAFAVTVLVLDIAVPQGALTQSDLLVALGGEWRSYLSYLVSFATIGAIWLAHSDITDYIARANALLIRLNLVLLLTVSLIPFSTRLLAEYLGRSGPERVAVTIYGINLLATGVLLSVLIRYATGAGLVRPGVRDEEALMLTKRLTPMLGAYVVLIAVGLVLPTVAIVGYFAIALYLIVWSQMRRRHQA